LNNFFDDIFVVQYEFIDAYIVDEFLGISSEQLFEQVVFLGDLVQLEVILLELIIKYLVRMHAINDL